MDLIHEIAQREGLKIDKSVEGVWTKYQLSDLNLDRAILRGEAALLFDYYLDPFNRERINIHGAFIQ